MTHPASQKKPPFIKGPLPLPWFERAAKCGPSAIMLGLLLYYKHGLGHQELSISAELVKRYSVSESTRRRTLRRMAAAGLIRLEIKGRQLRVVLLP